MNAVSSARKITSLAVMSALLVVGKWALNVIPNVEVVTLFCGLFGYVFGFAALIPATVFCIEETFVWGFNTWQLAYFIHWNLVTLLFVFLGRAAHEPKRKTDYFLPVVCGVLITATYGVLTSFIDALYAAILSDMGRLFEYFAIIYVRGVAFYAVHVISNAIILSVLFLPLSFLLKKLKEKVYR